MKFPQIDIRQTPVKLAISSEPGQFHIRQKNAILDIQTTQAVIDVKTEQPVVMVDMTKTWDALNGGGSLSFMNRLYNQFGQFVLDSINNTVQEYNQIGDLTIEYDPIPEIAAQNTFRSPRKMNLYGEASVFNVSFDVQISDPDIKITPGKAEVMVTPQKPEIEFERGGVNISVAQYQSVQITTPQIDLKR